MLRFWQHQSTPPETTVRKRATFSRTTIAVLCVSLVAVVAISAVLHAQSGRSYGPDRIWWNAGSGDILPWQEEYDNADGQVGVFNANGIVRTKGHPFFEALGENGRACVTCHQPSNAMSVSPVAVLGTLEGNRGPGCCLRSRGWRQLSGPARNGAKLSFPAAQARSVSNRTSLASQKPGWRGHRARVPHRGGQRSHGLQPQPGLRSQEREARGLRVPAAAGCREPQVPCLGRRVRPDGRWPLPFARSAGRRCRAGS